MEKYVMRYSSSSFSSFPSSGSFLLPSSSMRGNLYRFQKCCVHCEFKLLLFTTLSTLFLKLSTLSSVVTIGN